MSGIGDKAPAGLPIICVLYYLVVVGSGFGVEQAAQVKIFKSDSALFGQYARKSRVFNPVVEKLPLVGIEHINSPSHRSIYGRESLWVHIVAGILFPKVMALAENIAAQLLRQSDPVFHHQGRIHFASKAFLR